MRLVYRSMPLGSMVLAQGGKRIQDLTGLEYRCVGQVESVDETILLPGGF